MLKRVRTFAFSAWVYRQRNAVCAYDLCGLSCDK